MSVGRIGPASTGFETKSRWWTQPEWLAYAVLKIWVAAWVTFIGLWLIGVRP